MDRKQIIVFAPHPDDETLGCGGTVAKKLAEGYNVIIIVMTDGRFLLRKSFEIADAPSFKQIKAIRRCEVLRATKILGVPKQNVVFLDFIDGTLWENEKTVEEKVTAILDKFQPSEVYLPHKRDSHTDHQATNSIVEKAIKKLAIKPVVYQYLIVHKSARFGRLVESFISIFKRNAVYVDVSEFLQLKREAVKEFKFELTMVSKMQSKPNTIEFKKFLKKKEIFYIAK